MLLLVNFKQKVPIRDLFDIYLGEISGKYTPANLDGKYRIITSKDIPALPYTAFNFANLGRINVSDEKIVNVLNHHDYLIKLQGCIEGFSLSFSKNEFEKLVGGSVLVSDSFLILRPKETWKTLFGNNINYFHYLLDNLVLKIKESLRDGTGSLSAESIGLSKVFINLEHSEELKDDLGTISDLYTDLGKHAAKMSSISAEMISLLKVDSSSDIDLIDVDPNLIHKPEIASSEVKGYKKYWIIDNNMQKSLKDWARENKDKFDSRKYNFDQKILPTTQEIERVIRKLNFKSSESNKGSVVNVIYRLENK